MNAGSQAVRLFLAGAVVALAVQATPAAAAPQAPTSQAVQTWQGASETTTSTVAPAAWTTSSKGGPLRTSPYGASSVIVGTYSGEILTVYGTVINSYGNKWYDVIDSVGYSGYIYCANVTAGC
ncbi:hypothetical protein ACFQ61_09490 [Streptomyces sp. NPDC056500]|uniref:hypothetical protein n=1 Tax=Streptomyces sp. NPDC056500 TaxID=3345840 RepID=UPI0036B97167